jgi:hypothetical protein
MAATKKPSSANMRIEVTGFTVYIFAPAVRVKNHPEHTHASGNLKPTGELSWLAGWKLALVACLLLFSSPLFARSSPGASAGNDTAYFYRVSGP